MQNVRIKLGQADLLGLVVDAVGGGRSVASFDAIGYNNNELPPVLPSMLASKARQTD